MELVNVPPVREIREDQRVRRFFGTQNNYVVEGEGDAQRPVLFRFVRANPRITYFVGACEVGANGTPHVQFYFELSSGGAAATIAQVQRWETFQGQGCALFAAMGNRAQCRTYCLKNPNPVGWFLEYQLDNGEEVVPHPPRGQGQRNDWIAVHELAQRGAPDVDFVNEVPHLAYRHIGLLNAWRRVHAPEQARNAETRMIVYVGPTGGGKTHRALDLCAQLAGGAENVYHHNSNRRWFDGYTNQSVMYIDEFNGSFFSFDELKRLLGRVPYRLEQRGVNGGAQFVAHTLVVSTNHHPRYWYDGVGPWDASNPLLRRLQRGEVWYVPSPRVVDNQTIYQEPVRDWLGANPDADYIMPPELLEGLEFLDEYERDYRARRNNRGDLNGVPVRRFDFGINSE